MKPIYLICLLIFTLFTSNVYTFDDSTKAKLKVKGPVKTTNIQFTDSTAVDKNKKRDVFIDKDGDGICDKRVKGMSFEKFRKRHKGSNRANHGYRRIKK